MKKNDSGITLASLVITVIVLIILASITVYSGVSTIRSARLSKFTIELKMMQQKVNELYDNYINNKTVTIDGEQFIGIGENQETTADTTEGDDTKTILEIGEQPSIFFNEEKLLGIFSEEKSGIEIDTIENIDNKYRYYNTETIKKLGLEDMEYEFFVDIPSRSIVSIEGFNDNGNIYYTLKQVPGGVYNVEYTQNTGIPTFDISYEYISDNQWRINISNIQYDGGYIDKWYVKYQIEGQNYWSTSEDLSFVVNNNGYYFIYIENGDIKSEQIEQALGVDARPVAGTGNVDILSIKEEVIEVQFLEGTGYGIGEANAPVIDESTMIPIKYNGTNWVVTTTTDDDWYNYDTEERKWANIMLSDGTYKAREVLSGTVIQDSELGSMFVWIPRYAYKIVYFENISDKQEYIEDKTNTSKIMGYSDARGFVDIEGKVPSELQDYNISSIPVGENYRPHPQFEGDIEEGGWNKKLTGIWVGKFETSNTKSAKGTNMILPNKNSQTNLSVSEMYFQAKDIGEKLNLGLNCHIAKNMEWGAVAYLTDSQYGLNGSDIGLNQCSSYITGAGKIIGDADSYDSSEITPEQRYNGNIGLLSSSTSNIYGVYDLSGGAWEYVMGIYADRDTPTLSSSGFTTETLPEKKYYNIYRVDDYTSIGDTLFEVSKWNSSNPTWDYSKDSFFMRGGYYGYHDIVTVNLYSIGDGSGFIEGGYRVMLTQ